MLGVGACGVFCGAFWWFPPSVVAAGGMVGLMVAAHVLGNSMGTQLRDRAVSRPPTLSRQQSDEAAAGRAPATHLGGHDTLGWIMLLPTAAGALLAMIGGCWWVESAYHIGFDPPRLAVAALAFGVLGGLAAFALATFSQVLAVAFWQALRHK